MHTHWKGYSSKITTTTIPRQPSPPCSPGSPHHQVPSAALTTRFPRQPSPPGSLGSPHHHVPSAALTTRLPRQPHHHVPPAALTTRFPRQPSPPCSLSNPHHQVPSAALTTTFPRQPSPPAHLTDCQTQQVSHIIGCKGPNPTVQQDLNALLVTAQNGPVECITPFCVSMYHISTCCGESPHTSDSKR